MPANWLDARWPTLRLLMPRSENALAVEIRRNLDQDFRLSPQDTREVIIESWEWLGRLTLERTTSVTSQPSTQTNPINSHLCQSSLLHQEDPISSRGITETNSAEGNDSSNHHYKPFTLKLTKESSNFGVDLGLEQAVLHQLLFKTFLQLLSFLLGFLAIRLISLKDRFSAAFSAHLLFGGVCSSDAVLDLGPFWEIIVRIFICQYLFVF